MSKIPILKATHISTGVWEFTCPLHDIEFRRRIISSPKHVASILEEHLDKLHPGTKAKIKVYSGTSSTNKTSVYTSPEEVKTKDDHV